MRLRLALTLVLCASAALAASSWRRYANDRFGVSADAPAGWREQPPPANDDGRIFLSPDGKAELTVNAGFVMEDNSAQALDERAQPREGERVAYTQRRARSITLSGLAGDKIFYRRTVLSCAGQVWNNAELAYPADQKAAYDAIVAHVAASLASGVPAGMQCKN